MLEISPSIKDKKGKRPSAILNKSALIFRRVDWNCVSAFSKSPVFVWPHVHMKTAFSKSSTLESVFEKFRFH